MELTPTRLTRRGFLAKAAAFGIAVPAASALLAACGGGSSGGSSSSGSSGSINVTGTEYKFDPNTITVKAGQQVTVHFVNKGTLQHNFVIDNVVKGSLLDPGKSEDLKFTAPSQPGDYQFYCDVAGHKELGMVGTLKVQ